MIRFRIYVGASNDPEGEALLTRDAAVDEARKLARLRARDVRVEKVDGAAKSVIGGADERGVWRWSRLCAGCGGTGWKGTKETPMKHQHCNARGYVLVAT